MADKQPWNPENGVAAFSAALTKAAKDKDFRARLIKSWDSARAAVSEVGDIEIPDRIRITFHDHELNEDYHVFYLPELESTPQDTKYEYATFFQGNYNAW